MGKPYNADNCGNAHGRHIVTVEGIREIAWWILGYGDQAEVIEPKELRVLIANRVRGMASIYGMPHRSGKSTTRPAWVDDGRRSWQRCGVA